MRVRFPVFVITLCVALAASVHGQLVREWKNVSPGGSLAACGGRYLATITAPGLTGDSAAFLRISDDAGATWRAALMEKPANIDAQYNWLPGPWRTRVPLVLEMPSPNLMLLVVGETKKDKPSTWSFPYLLRSTDFGRQWTRIDIAADSFVAFHNRLSMLDEHYGILVSGRNPTPGNAAATGFYATSDGGVTWTEIETHLDFDSQPPVTVKCLARERFVVSRGDSVFVTADSGRSWRAHPLPPTIAQSLVGYCLSFFSDSTWYVAGDGGPTGNGDELRDLLCVTTDAGATWRKMLDTVIVPSFGFTSVAFLDRDNGIVGGNGGTILRTTDGGGSWVKEVNPFGGYQERVSDVRFFAPEHIAAAAQGSIYLYAGRWNLKPPSAGFYSTGSGLLDFGVQWTRTAGGNTYDVQVAEIAPVGLPLYFPEDFDKSLIVDARNLVDTSLVIPGVKFEKRYYARVKVRNDTLVSDWSAAVLMTTPHDTATVVQLDSCHLLEPADLAQDLPRPVTFRWNSVPRAERYTLIVSKPEHLGSGAYDYEIGNLSDTTAVIADLQPGAWYLWWVRASAAGWADSYSHYRQFYIDEANAAGRVPSPGIALGAVYPNPCPDLLNVDYELPAACVAELLLVDLCGRAVARVPVGWPDGGAHTVSFSVSPLPRGSYLLLLRAGGVLCRRLVTVR
jgi:photosystem II stability/assembly factor-like uncharacterized protein